MFKLTPSGTLTNLVSFNGYVGWYPGNGLVQGSDGNFYGTTEATVFKMTPSGTLTNLVRFDSTNGYWPYDALVQGSDGNFYGTTDEGGNLSLNNGIGFGTVFKMTPSGTLTTLLSFNSSNGRYPQTAALLPVGNGIFYGTTDVGGTPFDAGPVFKLVLPIPELYTRWTGTNLVVFWPSALAGFLLQQNSNVDGGNWTTSGYPISDDGTNKSVSIPTPTGNLFFRLKQ